MTTRRLLLTADLHLTDRLEDAHRWDVFRRIKEVVAEKNVNGVAILGDLTDRKDCHPSRLVQRIIQELRGLPPTIILKGNHDYIEEGEPFFGFLGEIRWSTGMIARPVASDQLFLLPHTRNPEKEWEGLSGKRVGSVLLTHITLHGCKAANGMYLDGIPSSLLPEADIAFSGDIHLPQTMRYNDTDFVYVGSPYHTRFVYENYEPRFILVDLDDDTLAYQGHWESVPTGLKRKVAVSVNSPEELDPNLVSSIRTTDELRVVCHQPEGTTYKQWEPVLSQFRDKVPQAEVQPIIEGSLTHVNRDVKTHKDLLHAYCDERGITDSARKLGDDILGSVSSGSFHQELPGD